MDSNIKLARIDDRLIHGQVVTNWMKFTGAKKIIIIDDVTASDSFTSKVIEMAAPAGVELKIFTLNDAKEELKAELDKPTLLLAKAPRVYLELVEQGYSIPVVNLGGMGANPSRRKFFKNIAANEDERNDIRSLLKHGTEVSIQIISNDKKVIVSEDMLK